MKKIITIIALAMTFTGANAQTAMLTETETFEADGPGHSMGQVLSTGVNDFANPQVDANNGSATVAQIIRKENKNNNAKNSTITFKGDDGVDWKGMDFSTGKTSIRFKVMTNSVNPYNVKASIKHTANGNGSAVRTEDIPVANDGVWNTYEIDLSVIIDVNEPAFFYDFISLAFTQTVDPAVVGEEIYIDNVELFDPNSLSAKTNTISDLKVSPTAVVDFVNFTSASKINKVEVYSYTGQLVTEFTGKDIKSISMSGVKAGLYILNINSDLGIKAVKVIKK